MGANPALARTKAAKSPAGPIPTITALSIVETSVALAPDPSFLLYGNLYFTTVERVHLLFLAERSFFSFSNSASIVYT